MHHGRVVKRTGDGGLIEFRSVVDAVRCAIEVQNGLIERNAGLPPERRSSSASAFISATSSRRRRRSDGRRRQIAARLEGIAEPGAICLSEDAYRQVKGRLELAVADLGPTELKNIAKPIRVYSLQVGARHRRNRAGRRRLAETAFAARTAGSGDRGALVVAGGAWYLWRETGRPFSRLPRPPPRPRIFPSWCCPSRTSLAIRARIISPTASPKTSPRISRASATASSLRQHRLHLQGQEHRRQGDRQGTRRSLCARRLGAARPEPGARQRQLDAEPGAHLWADRFEED